MSLSRYLHSRVPRRIAGKIPSRGRARLRLEITLVALLAFSALVAAIFAQLTAAQDNPRFSQAALQSAEGESSKVNSPKPVAIPGEILVRFRKQAVQAKSTMKSPIGC